MLERRAFGNPLSVFQNTKYKLAKIATTIDLAWTFVDSSVTDLVATAKVSMVKLWMSEQGGCVMNECLQLFGGYDFMNKYPVARLYTDSCVHRIYGRTSERKRFGAPCKHNQPQRRL
ncbi:hypothetical protein NLU14_11400 [Marinobacter sp. 71-i]|uniref:Acyl-CoA dehydrogenase/oxidase C-terminal domain-containing protein n=1 Tax=Marinobacter iranensis TaxID=2962607 RepID=A0ABT5YAY8_9GAMM|nr:hypothetical protein [Marinobacter iranensis]